MKQGNILIVGIVILVLGYNLVSQLSNTNTPSTVPITKAPDKSTTLEVLGLTNSISWPPATLDTIELASNPMTDNYLLMMDISGSMADKVCLGDERKIDAAKRAVKAFFKNLGTEVNVGLYTFSKDVSEVLPIGKYANTRFDQAIDSLRAGGNTPLQAALKRSEKLLRSAAQTQGGYGSYNLILITDGQSSDGKPHDLAVEIARSTAITLNAVGFCTGINHSLNIDGYTNFLTADNAEQLVQQLSKTVKAEQEAFDISDFNAS